MNLIKLIAILIVLPIISSEEGETVPSLCDDPEIHAADRLKNGTYRVYRGNHYWELIGLPDKVVRVNGPFRVWYQHFGTLDKTSSLHTVIGGNADGMLFKYQGNKYWLYRQDGSQISGSKTGWDWPYLPKNGFSAVYNDGMLSGLGYPLMVAFTGIRVYYFIANDRDIRPFPGAPPEGYEGGKDGENFPTELTAAFAFPSTNPSKTKYYVYLFQRRRYCYRPITGENGCKDWRENRELFGCIVSNSSLPTTTAPEQTEPNKPSDNPMTQDPGQEGDPGLDDDPGKNKSVDSYDRNTILLLISIYFVLKF